uniref:Major facilitator superfamily (MFS) profile domain-containing protein n=1 Tax=Araucaria cunninghamii TaxID=56994 RepID=A0A0D6R3B4_ARACU
MAAMPSVQEQQQQQQMRDGSLAVWKAAGDHNEERNGKDNNEGVDFRRSGALVMIPLPLLSTSATKDQSMEEEKEEKAERDAYAGASQQGGWKTMPYIIANEACEKLATIGLLANLIVYLTTIFNMPNVAASNVINIWSGTTNLSPVLGAFLSDSYIGRFWTIAFGCVASLVGMGLLTLTAVFPGLRPPPCGIHDGIEYCRAASPRQDALLYSSFVMMTIGAGGIRPCSIAFGADQFDYTSDKGKRSIASFFNWYYFSFTVAVMISLTIIVYIQDSVSWGWGMGIPTALMFLSVTSFFLGKSLYIRISPEGSSFTSFAQVVAAAYKKRHLSLPSPSEEAQQFYDPPMKETAVGAKSTSSSRILPVTRQLMFLNKAAIKTEQDFREDGSVVDPWRICSLQQVEELKSVIRIAPIWLAGINICVCMAQLNTFSVLQAQTMNRHLGSHFKIPAGTFGIFTMLTLTFFLPIYDRIVVPYSRRRSKQGQGITLLQRIGMGYAVIILSMALAAVFETKRRHLAVSNGFQEKAKAVVPMSAFWLVPQYAVAGIAEGFSMIGLIEFLYSQFPENMRSVAGALFFLNLGLGNYISSFLVTVVHKTTGGRHHYSWLGQNLNRSKLDNFYWLLAGLAVLNLVYFLVCARWYRYKTTVRVDVRDVSQPMSTSLNNGKETKTITIAEV